MAKIKRKSTADLIVSRPTEEERNKKAVNELKEYLKENKEEKNDEAIDFFDNLGE